MAASVAGLDIGDQSSCIAVARKRGVDVLLNKESKRETPTVVAFTTKQRLLGTAAAGSIAINPKNAISQIKRLLGKSFSSPAVQKDIQQLPYEVVAGPNDSILVGVDYLGERQYFTPEQILAMLIVDLKAIAEADGSPVTDCVISIPVYFTERERYGMLNAAQIAGVNCLRLMHDNSATALAYGIYKTDLPEDSPVHVVFVDVGYTSLQVSVVAFKKGQLRVLAHAWDRNVGGRDFDEVLYEHFVEEFDGKHKIDIRSNKRASFRLRLACERLKKVLSSIPESVLNVESLTNDVDVRGNMTREVFEQRAQPVLDRVKLPLQQALDASGIAKEDIASVEVVGSSSRVPALLALMREVFGKEPSRTLNAKECVARGCALQCAMLSPIFRVRDFEIMDILPYGIQFEWDKDGEMTKTTLFERNCTIPSTKMLTFFRNTTFKLTAEYTDDSPIPEGEDRVIGTWTIGPPVSPGAPGVDKAKLKVKVRLNLHGLVTVESVQQVEEEEYEEVVKKAPKTVEIKDEAMADAEAGLGAEPDAAAGPPPATEDGAATAAGGAMPMETDAGAAAEAGPKEAEEMEVVKKRRTRKTSIPLQAATGGYDLKAVQDLFEKECQMALQDRVQEETSERKNALEAYIYSLRNKLSDVLTPYVTEEDRAALLDRLEKAEDWLYDEGEDESKGVYTAKLEELLRAGSPIESRAKEAASRPTAAAALSKAANHYLSVSTGDDPKHGHIPEADRHKVAKEAQAALDWLAEKQHVQDGLRKTDPPELLTADIEKKQSTLSRFAEPILSQPPPQPAKKEKAGETAKEAGSAEPEVPPADADGDSEMKE